MYKVIKHFIDLHDNDHSYNVGDKFPREGVTVEESRIQELAGSNNKQNTPLIELVEEPVEEPAEESNGVEKKKTPTKAGRKKTQSKPDEDENSESGQGTPEDTEE